MLKQWSFKGSYFGIPKLILVSSGSFVMCFSIPCPGGGKKLQGRMSDHLQFRCFTKRRIGVHSNSSPTNNLSKTILEYHVTVWRHYKNDPIVATSISPCRTYSPIGFLWWGIARSSLLIRDLVLEMPVCIWAASKIPTRCIAVAGCSNTTKESVKSIFSSQKTVISANSRCWVCSQSRNLPWYNPGNAPTKWECFASVWPQLAVMLFCHWPVTKASLNSTKIYF